MKFLRKLALAVVLDILIVWAMCYIYITQLSQEAMEKRIYDIYDQVWATTGLATEKIPLQIVDSPVINAYNDGMKIVIYTGLIKHVKNSHELALVIGHEIAHGTLWHLKMMRELGVSLTDNDVSVLESNADKMGAIYIMKAGYDICKAREWFKTLLSTNGDYLGGDHPTYSYRYTQLNINCE